MAFKLTLAIDYDGVINPYSKGWQKGELYETKVTDGFWQWLERFDGDWSDPALSVEGIKAFKPWTQR
jgi:hypothetical protein